MNLNQSLCNRLSNIIDSCKTSNHFIATYKMIWLLGQDNPNEAIILQHKFIEKVQQSKYHELPIEFFRSFTQKHYITTNNWVNQFKAVWSFYINKLKNQPFIQINDRGAIQSVVY